MGEQPDEQMELHGLRKLIPANKKLRRALKRRHYSHRLIRQVLPLGMKINIFLIIPIIIVCTLCHNKNERVASLPLPQTIEHRNHLQS